ncbi:MAG: hypothetical protein ACOZCL_08885 [Bacillota bacterium]
MSNSKIAILLIIVLLFSLLQVQLSPVQADTKAAVAVNKPDIPEEVVLHNGFPLEQYINEVGETSNMWKAGDPHVHTKFGPKYFEGEATADNPNYTLFPYDTIVRKGIELGLDWMVIADNANDLGLSTDHGYYPNYSDLTHNCSGPNGTGGFVLFPGYELYCAETRDYQIERIGDMGMHISTINIGGFKQPFSDPYRLEGEARAYIYSDVMARYAITEIQQSGGIPIFNHPAAHYHLRDTSNTEFEFFDPRHILGYELINTYYERKKWMDHDENVKKWVEQCLLKGLKALPFSASDAGTIDSYAELGSSATVVFYKHGKDMNSVLLRNALKSGNMYVTTGPGVAVWAKPQDYPVSDWTWMGDKLYTDTGYIDLLISYACDSSTLITVSYGQIGNTSEVYKTSFLAGPGKGIQKITVNGCVGNGYVRVTAIDQNNATRRAYTTPIWTGAAVDTFENNGSKPAVYPQLLTAPLLKDWYWGDADVQPIQSGKTPYSMDISQDIYLNDLNSLKTNDYYHGRYMDLNVINNYAAAKDLDWVFVNAESKSQNGREYEIFKESCKKTPTSEREHVLKLPGVQTTGYVPTDISWLTTIAGEGGYDTNDGTTIVEDGYIQDLFKLTFYGCNYLPNVTYGMFLTTYHDYMKAQLLIDNTKKESGFSMINHPGLGDEWTFYQEVQTASYERFRNEDTMEILRRDTMELNNNSIESWVKNRLLKGYRTYAIAGSSTKAVGSGSSGITLEKESIASIGRSATAVYLDRGITATAEEIKKAVMKGHSFVTTRPSIGLWANVNNTGLIGMGMSSNWMYTGVTEQIPVTLELRAADLSDKLKIRVLKGVIGSGEEEVILEETFDRGYPERTITLSVSSDNSCYFRAECVEEKDSTKVAYTNPIWVSFWRSMLDDASVDPDWDWRDLQTINP